MTDLGMSSSELLLNNLNDHQVIRIEGRLTWMHSLMGLVKESQPDHLELTGELELHGLQAVLADYLSVESGASFIQQALKSRLAAGNKLLLIVNSEEIDTQALTYLLGLPSICNEEGSAVTILLLSTSSLISVLKSTPALAAKLDGYYQEDKDESAAAGFKVNKTAVAAVISLLCLGAGGWYVLQHSSDQIEPILSSTKDHADTEEPLIQKPVTQDVLGTHKESTSIQRENENSVVTEDVRPQLAATVSKVEPVESKEQAVAAASVNSSLAADLAATIEKAQGKGAQKRIATPVKPVAVSASSSTEGLKPSDNVEQAPDQIVPPVLFKPVKSAASLNNEAEVRKVVDNWGKAWESQNWDSYIGSYVQHTNLYGVKMSIEEWRAFRKKRLLTPEWIKLELGKPKYTRLNTHWYRVEFYQRFEKPGYADETTKRLELTLTSYGWKIASEAADGTVVLKRPGG